MVRLPDLFSMKLGVPKSGGLVSVGKQLRSIEAATSITQIWVGQNQDGGCQYVVTGFSFCKESSLTRDDLKDHCPNSLCLVQSHNTRKEMQSAVRAAGSHRGSPKE